MSVKLGKYLTDLRNNAIRFERIDINGTETTSFFGKNRRRILALVMSGLLVYFVDTGLSQNFISYASTILAILIGLFINALIFSLDKFYKKSNSPNPNAHEKLNETQSYNFAKQFAYITGYNIILSVFVLVLLSLNSLFEKHLGININNYVFDLTNITTTSIGNFLLGCVVIFLRFFVFYWITSIVYNTLFAVSSMVNFMTVKMDKS